MMSKEDIKKLRKELDSFSTMPITKVFMQNEIILEILESMALPEIHTCTDFDFTNANLCCKECGEPMYKDIHIDFSTIDLQK